MQRLEHPQGAVTSGGRADRGQGPRPRGVPSLGRRGGAGAQAGLAVGRAGLNPVPPAAPAQRSSDLLHIFLPAPFSARLPRRASACYRPGYSPQNRKELDMTEPQSMHMWPVNNIAGVLGEQQRDSAIHTHGSILPPHPLPIQAGTKHVQFHVNRKRLIDLENKLTVAGRWKG